MPPTQAFLVNKSVPEMQLYNIAARNSGQDDAEYCYLECYHNPHTVASTQGELKLAAKGAGGGGMSAAGDSSTEQSGDVPTEEDEFDLKDLMSEEIGVRRRAHLQVQDFMEMSTALLAYHSWLRCAPFPRQNVQSYA